MAEICFKCFENAFEPQDYQLKIDSYIQRYTYIYTYLMVTINEKPKMDTQKIKRKGSKHNAKRIHQTPREANMKRQEQTTVNKKAISNTC